jgi:hypothetical protein
VPAPLVAEKGAILAHHFAHEGDHSCQGAYESMVHNLAKEIIAEDKGLNIRLDGGLRLPPPSSLRRTVFRRPTVEIEPWRDGIRPGIIVRREEHELAVEIYVTHRCDSEKLAIIKERDLATMEIRKDAGRRSECKASQTIPARRAEAQVSRPRRDLDAIDEPEARIPSPGPMYASSTRPAWNGASRRCGSRSNHTPHLRRH